MKWEITDSNPHETKFMVEIVRGLNSVKGVWLSETPLIGQTTYVELDINASIEDLDFTEYCHE